MDALHLALRGSLAPKHLWQSLRLAVPQPRTVSLCQRKVGFGHCQGRFQVCPNENAKGSQQWPRNRVMHTPPKEAEQAAVRARP